MRRSIAIAALALLGAAQDFSANSYLGKAPPELTGDASNWFNAKDGLTLAAQKGKVVWLEFGFLG